MFVFAQHYGGAGGSRGQLVSALGNTGDHLESRIWSCRIKLSNWINILVHVLGCSVISLPGLLPRNS